jgi:hypothetical protein
MENHTIKYAGAVVEMGTAAQIGCMSMECADEPAIVYPAADRPTVSNELRQ